MIEKIQNTIELFKFETIEKISEKYAAFDNYPATRIDPFNKNDVLTSIKNNELDSRHFQSKEVQQEFQQLLDKLSQEGKSHTEKDRLLKIHARKYHIARCAYFAQNSSPEPIIVNSDFIVKDGTHRIIAALVRNEKDISYKIE